MATISTKGVEDWLKSLQDFGDSAAEAIPDVLKAGADEAQRQMETTSAWHDRTGELRNSLTQSTVYGEGAGSYIDVYPDGMTHDKTPQRLAEVGFVLEYGRTNMPPRPWIRPAIEDHGAEIAKAMQEKWEALGDG